MRNILLLGLFFFTMCNSKKTAEMKYDGRFKGSSDGISATANLTESETGVKGTITMNGQPADLRGKIDDKGIWGTLHDNATGNDYKYEGEVVDDELVLTITFPELNNKKIKLRMQRESRPAAKKDKRGSNSKELDPDVVGTWKHTEFLGGNGGESMTNESWMEFQEDGTCISWPGLSSGPGYFREEDKSKATTGKWYTSGGKLYLADAETGEEAGVDYTVNPDGMLLSNGGSAKKLLQRMN